MPQGHNPFVLVNYSPTICLNPPSLIIGGLKSWPITVGQEKRYDGGPAKSQGSAQVTAFGSDPADRGWLDSWRAPAWGLRRHAAKPRLAFQSIQYRPFGAGSAAARCGRRAGQGGIDPAAVGFRECRRRGAVDEECRRDGAGGISESQYPASDQG